MHSTREDWLQAAVEEVRPIFDLMGKPLPKRIRTSCGYPLHYKRNQRIADSHASEDSADRSMEIFIAPSVSDPTVVFTALLGQLCRATNGAWSYGSTYTAVAYEVGLVPDMSAPDIWRSTKGGENFNDMYGDMIAGLGAYPHASLALNEKKTQSTRMLKAYCSECGYTVRLTSKWALAGLPICPLDGTSFQLESTPETV
jgi:hypothetical protein